MERRAISNAMVAVIVVIVIGIGASAYYVGAVLPGAQTTATSTVLPNSSTSTTKGVTDTMMSTTSTSSMMSSSSSTMTQSSMMSSSSTTSSMVSTVSTSSMMSSSTTTSSVQSSSGQGATLQIAASQVSHSLSGASVAATCGSTTPAQGASYLKVTNTGTVSSTISNISFNYVDMATESGAPYATCTVAAGATVYVTLTAVGLDMATAGEMFTVSVTGTNGGFAYAGGNFG
ncbi:MAG: hypothetical protein OK455_10865 [Thaumarchaeota archaeon]|nr:hypothetical protein [Nitrososphaerota archaeon]